MKKKTMILAVLAVVLVLTASLGSAWAYFTASTEASGGYKITLNTGVTPDESFSDWTKHVTVTANEDSMPVFVRAIAYAGSQYKLDYLGEDWELGADGYYYYKNVLNASESTSELLIAIGNVPDDALVGDAFNVIVKYESTPALYNEDGTITADWNAVLASDNVEGGDK